MSNNTSISQEDRRANTQIFGLDINLPVFFISAGLAVIFSVFVLIYPDISFEFLTSAVDFVVVRFGTLFTLSMSAFTLIIFFLILSPFGKIRLGGIDAVPEFNYPSWICMLFAAGVGYRHDFLWSCRATYLFHGCLWKS